MSYSFYNSYMNNIASDPNVSYANDLQAFVNEQFDNATTIYDIEEELVFGTKDYSEVSVRINHVINSATGQKYGNDYRKFIFKELDHVKGDGYRYTLDGNIWLTINSDDYKYSTSSTVVRRCNVVLKWYDDNGVLQEEPAFIEDTVGASSLTEDKNMVVSGGRYKGAMQLNSYSDTIIEGQEFIIGSTKKAKYRISFENMIGFEGLLTFRLERYQKNADLDDLESITGIANFVEREIYTMSIVQSTSEFSIGESIQLEYSLIDKDGLSSDKSISWSTSDSLIATIDSNGLVTGVSNGNVTITIVMDDNTSVTDSIALEVTSTPIDNYELIVDNNTESITRTETEIFNWTKINNSVPTTSEFDFSVDSSTTASSDEYEFVVIDDNTYTIKCIGEGNNLYIKVEDKNSALIETINYKLAGYWG